MSDEYINNISLVAYKNRKNRFFIPSKKNYFNNYQVEYIMIDNGCNTLLLPIKENYIEFLYKEFPLEKYRWIIDESKGVATLQSPVLRIESKPENIEVNLNLDICPYKMFVNFLRFNICYDDALILQKNSNIENVDKLKDFIIMIEKIKTSDNKIQVGIRRKHGLLGQFFLSKNNMTSIQLNEIFICLNTYIDKLPSTKIFREWISKSEKNIESYFNESEFDDLEDECHYIDKCNNYVVNYWNFIDE